MVPLVPPQGCEPEESPGGEQKQKKSARPTTAREQPDPPGNRAARDRRLRQRAFPPSLRAFTTQVVPSLSELKRSSIWARR